MAAGDKGREPQATSLLVSVIFHGVVVLGIAASSWWWGGTVQDTWKTYNVSLVDMPLSLRPSTSPASPDVASPPKSNAKSDSTSKVIPPGKPKVAKPVSEPKVKPPAPAKVVEPAPEPKTKPAPAKVVKPAPKPKTKPPVASPQAPKISTSREARSAIEALRQRQAKRDQVERDAEATQQQAVSARVAALRDQLAQEETVGGAAVRAAGVQRVRLIAYQDRVRAKIVEAWILPLSAEQTRDLQATTQFQVTRDGNIRQLELIKPSGNGLFDASLLRAIRRASPLPALPDDYPVDILEVEMRFRAES